MTVLAEPSVVEVAHGWTTHQIDELARFAVRQTRAGKIAGFNEYVDVATAAIHDHLLDAVDPPTETDLIRAAGRGIHAFTGEWEREHGWNHKALADRPRFVRFWFNPHPGRPEEIVVERMAVKQIMPTLSPQMQAAVNALVYTDGDQQAAAAVLGISQSTFRARLRAARLRFQEWWFEGEVPPRPIWRVHNPASRARHGVTWCSVDGCDRVHVARGLCGTHYAQQWRESRVCKVDGCDREVKARDLCWAHHEQRDTEEDN